MRTLRNRPTLLAALAVTGTSLLATATASAEPPYIPGSVTSRATSSGIEVCVTQPRVFDPESGHGVGGNSTCFTISG